MSDRTSPNQDAFRTIGGRKTRATLIFFACIAMIVLGCGGPCVVSFFVPEVYKPYFGMAALGLPIIGLIGAILMYSDKSKCARQLELVEFAEEKELRFVEKPKAKVWERLAEFRLFSEADEHNGAVNHMKGTIDEWNVQIMEHTYSILGADLRRSPYQQTVILVSGFSVKMPEFMLLPNSWVEKLFAKLGGKEGIVLKDQDAFSDEFFLAGGQKTPVAALFTKRVVALCMANTDVSLELHDGTLLVSRMNSTGNANACEDLLDCALTAALQLQKAASGK